MKEKKGKSEEQKQQKIEKNDDGDSDSDEVVGVIGRGGMGVVFKAYEGALNRFVAIKMLLPHLAASGAARKRPSELLPSALGGGSQTARPEGQHRRVSLRLATETVPGPGQTRGFGSKGEKVLSCRLPRRRPWGHKGVPFALEKDPL